MGDLVPLYPDGQPYDGLMCGKCGSAWGTRGRGYAILLGKLQT